MLLRLQPNSRPLNRLLTANFIVAALILTQATLATEARTRNHMGFTVMKAVAMTSDDSAFPLLETINYPEPLRKLPQTALKQLASELRAFLIHTLNQCGGHFGAGLGVIELTIALHYVFNTPEDRLVWDVGHQAYPHKVLTERRNHLHTIRQTDGLAPFVTPEESVYDTFSVGHSSTSISAALGMSIASKLDHNQRKIVAIIGDGGLTGGMAFEALNHAGSLDSNLLVILNDNEMSISRNVGALTNYLARILSGPIYSGFREQSKKILGKIPRMKNMVKRTETHLKGMITPGTLFEELGFNYYGPIDGHNIDTLISTLHNLKDLQGARLLHIKTVKGKGYSAGESDPIKYHAVKAGFNNPSTETQLTAAKFPQPSYSEVFGNWLCDMAAQDKNLLGITPAMCEGSGMVRFAKEYPEHYFDVSIAEQHSVTFAAGLACEGKKPVVAIYSTFLQRAYDQLIHDVALQNLDVTFAIDRAGVVADGPTHAGIFDLSYLRCIPNLVVMAPSDENECRQMLYTAYQYRGPSAVRYPRGTGPGVTIEAQMQALPIGKALTKRKGQKVAILAFGAMLTPVLMAGEHLNATVVNMRFIKPIDEKLIQTLTQSHQLLVTVEENVIMGGAGSAVNEFLAAINSPCSILNLGIPDAFPRHGDPKDELHRFSLDSKGIIASITKRLKQLTEKKLGSVNKI